MATRKMLIAALLAVTCIAWLGLIIPHWFVVVHRYREGDYGIASAGAAFGLLITVIPVIALLIWRSDKP